MRLLISTAVCFICALAFADSLDKVVAKVTKAQSTNAVLTEVTTSRITGYLKRIDVTVAETTNIVESVVIASSNVLTGFKTTLKSLTAVAANASYQLNTNAVPICVFDEIIYLTVTNTCATNNSVQATVIYEAK